MKKQLSVDEIIRLEKILDRVRKRRVQKKLVRRISRGTLEYWLKWLEDDKAHQTIDSVPGGVRQPDNAELARRYGEFK